MPSSEQKSLNALLSNCFPLSKMSTLGIPYLQMMFLHTKVRMLFSMIVARGSTSTHLVKQLIPTTRYFSCLRAVGKGPIMSSPHWANGQGAVIGVSSSDGCLIRLLNL